MSTIPVGNAPCSWGSLEFENLDGRAIGYRQMLDELTATGYRGTELGDWGFMPTDPAELQAELESRGLRMLGAFVPVALKDPEAHGAGAERAVKTARLLAEVQQRMPDGVPPFLVLADDNGTQPERTQNAGRITPQLALTDPEWTVFAKGANQVARAVREETGLRTVFHHHAAGYVETPDEIATFLDRTDPELIGLVLDTGHLVFGSPDHRPDIVTEALERFGPRIQYMHFKDCHPDLAARSGREGWDYFTSVSKGVFCELGKGCVPFDQVIAWLNARHYPGWIVVEQDVLPGLGSPRESAQRNRDYLKSLGI